MLNFVAGYSLKIAAQHFIAIYDGKMVFIISLPVARNRENVAP